MAQRAWRVWKSGKLSGLSWPFPTIYIPTIRNITFYIWKAYQKNGKLPKIKQMTTVFLTELWRIALAGRNGFLHPYRPRGGGPLTVPLLMADGVNVAEKSERAGRDEKKRMGPEFKVLGNRWPLRSGQWPQCKIGLDSVPTDSIPIAFEMFGTDSDSDSGGEKAKQNLFRFRFR